MRFEESETLVKYLEVDHLIVFAVKVRQLK